MEDQVLTLNEEDKAFVQNLFANEMTTRSELMNRLIDPRRDIDKECGYPTELTVTDYKIMYDREGVAARVVNLFPEESWAEDPMVVENEDPDETEFEEAFNDLEERTQLWSYLANADKLSGIGRFGILLLGFNDGKELNEPLDGVGGKEEKTGSAKHELMYLRAFDESLVTVKSVETDRTTPRYSKPTMYEVSFETGAIQQSGTSTASSTAENVQVHWTRIVHLADNRQSSEVYGTPRMQTLFNRLYDLRKISGGSGEMFWKGGFPGYSFEMDPQAKPLGDDEKTALRKQVADYANGLQRYLTLQGITTKSLTPQVADPRGHIEIQLNLIAVALGVPKRVFEGSERGELSSSQDSKAWDKRVRRRQNKYLTPYAIKPAIDRLIAAGSLPEPKDGYTIQWGDLETQDPKTKAEVFRLQVEAFSKYVAGNVDQLIPPEVFLAQFAGMTPDQIEAIQEAAKKREGELEEDEEAIAKAEEEARELAEAEARGAAEGTAT